MIITRTEQVWLKSSEALSRLCHLSKNLYNEGNYLIRQEFFTNGKWIPYNSLYYLIKSSDNYKQLPAQTTQQVLKFLNRNWTSFFRAINGTWKGDPRDDPNIGWYITIETMQVCDEIQLRRWFYLDP